MIIVTGWILFSLKRYIEFLISNIYKYGLIWKKGLCRFTQVKIKSLGFTMIGILIQREYHVMTEAETGAMQSQAKE